MKDIGMVIYSQVIRVAKTHLQLPPAESETVGPAHRRPLPALQWSRRPRWPDPSPAPASQKKEGKKRRFTLETFFPLTVSGWKNFSSQRRGWPQRSERSGGGRCRQAACPAPLPAPLRPCSSSLPAACHEVVITERRAHREWSNHLL